MKSRITGKTAKRKTIEERLKEFNMLEEKTELENIQNEEIIRKGEKKKVSRKIYQEHFDPGECRYCMNYIFETDSCKKNMPFIDPWYIKDNNLIEVCQKWDYIYENDEKNAPE